MTWNGFKGRARRIDDVDLPLLGRQIGVGEDELHAVIDVESRGSGFDGKGRPLILYEPHVVYRCASSKVQREKLVAAGLAYLKWGEKPYGKESEQYPKLIKAMAIDEAAALKGCSWGMFQVLAENAESLGWSSVQAFVTDMMDDEENHLKAAIEFIRVNGIDDELQAIAALKRPSTPEDWAPFVRVYNGPGYKKNAYHIKAAKSHNRWRGIRDTPIPEATDIKPVAPLQPKPAAPAPVPVPASPTPAAPAPAVIERQTGKADWITALVNAIAALLKGPKK